MVQLAYSIDPAVAREGNIVSTDPGGFVVSKLAVEGIDVGRLAVLDLTDAELRSCKLPALALDITDGARVLGVSMMDVSLEATPGTDPLYGITEAVPLVRRGRIWVRAEDIVAAPGAVYVRFQNGTGTNPIGRFAGAASADHALLAGAQFISTTAAVDELIALEIHLPA